MIKDRVQKGIFIFILLLIGACHRGVPNASSIKTDSALYKIKKSGLITVITQNNPCCYYRSRGKPMGFEYELAQSFARYLGVRLRVQVIDTWDELIEKKDQTHFIAANLSPSIEHQKKLDYSTHYLTVKQYIICHKDNYEVRELKDLMGKTIHVPQGSPYEDRLKELQQNGLSFVIKTYQDLTTEELIEMVAKKEIDITVANSNLASFHRRYHPDISFCFSIKEKQPLAWAVPQGEEDLLNEINQFFKTIKKNGSLDKIFERYYADLEFFDYVDIKKYHNRLETRLPKYKKIIKAASHKYAFDWRLIAALMYQESHFDPEACSFTGVQGLMQLTVPTAKEMGIENRLDPHQSIPAGVKYLRILYDFYDQIDGLDRLLISLAAYNIGPGHIQDAQEIARQLGLDPYKWASMKRTLPLLTIPYYYQQSKYGYCRGYEPIRFIQRIMTYYDILKQKTTEMACSITPDRPSPPSSNTSQSIITLSEG